MNGLNIDSIEIDEDVYYNRIVNSKRMTCLRSFHNYIKSILIKSVSNKGDIRTLRGGSFLEIPERAQIGSTASLSRDKNFITCSFRIARTLPT